MSRNAGYNEGPVFTKKLDISQVAVVSGVYKSFDNPFGADVVIMNAYIDIVNGSDGASTVDIGVAADAVTSNDTLFDGVSLATNGALGMVNSKGTNGGVPQLWTTTKYLNIAEASGDVAGSSEVYLVVEYTYR